MKEQSLKDNGRDAARWGRKDARVPEASSRQHHCPCTPEGPDSHPAQSLTLDRRGWAGQGRPQTAAGPVSKQASIPSSPPSPASLFSAAGTMRALSGV